TRLFPYTTLFRSDLPRPLFGLAEPDRRRLIPPLCAPTRPALRASPRPSPQSLSGLWPVQRPPPLLLRILRCRRAIRSDHTSERIDAAIRSSAPPDRTCPPTAPAPLVLVGPLWNAAVLGLHAALAQAHAASPDAHAPSIMEALPPVLDRVGGPWYSHHRARWSRSGAPRAVEFSDGNPPTWSDVPGVIGPVPPFQGMPRQRRASLASPRQQAPFAYAPRQRPEDPLDL